MSLSPISAAAQLALLASLSAMLSAYASPGTILVPYFQVPVIPAVYFGLVLCAGVYLWNSKSKLHLVAVFVATIIGWTGAWEGAVTVFSSTSGSSCPFCPLTTEMTEMTRKAASGLVGGFIGSLSILLAMVFIDRDFRNWTISARILGIGTSAGLVLAGCDLSPKGDLLPLYLVWQPAMAASIAYTLARSRSRPVPASRSWAASARRWQLNSEARIPSHSGD